MEGSDQGEKWFRRALGSKNESRAKRATNY